MVNLSKCITGNTDARYRYSGEVFEMNRRLDLGQAAMLVAVQQDLYNPVYLFRNPNRKNKISTSGAGQQRQWRYDTYLFNKLPPLTHVHVIPYYRQVPCP